MQWAVLERSVVARYALAAVLGGLAAGAHWAMYPYIQGRIPFLLFLPSIVLATALAGRGPGMLVLAIGAVNASLQLAPVGSIAVAGQADRLVLAAYVLTGVLIALLGDRLRVSAKRQYDDLHELHELSVALAPVVERDSQLELILRTLARMHGTDQGLVSLYDPATNTLSVAVSQRFSPDALAALQHVQGGQGACGIACLEARRVVITDVNHEECFSPFRDLAAREGFRAVHSTPILSRSGQTVGALSVHFRAPRRPSRREMHLADICANKAAVAIERAAAEQLRSRQEEALREGDRRKDEFLATLAHELRNPLAPIRQSAAVANSDKATDTQRRWAYSVIQRQVEHMSLLLDDLLDVSRITRGTLSLRKQPVELTTVINAAIETARPLIDSRHHKLTIEVPAGLTLVGDPLRLSQIFANLLTNAAKYTPPQGTIRLLADTNEGTLVVSVHDTGIGLRAEDMPLIFEMFSQARSTQEHTVGGLGIGLALTKGLVEMHGGKIKASSAGAGKGSTFTVRLPIGDVSQMKPDVAEARKTRLTVSRRVLIVDDNNDAAESLAIVLRLEGHHVAVAADGESALRMIEDQTPEVVLLDIGMPGMTGYEVARRIRERPACRDVFLLALTGWGQEKDRQESKAAGFDHHLTKPVEPDLIVQLVAGTRTSPSRSAAAPGT